MGRRLVAQDQDTVGGVDRPVVVDVARQDVQPTG
jgi:hypothetical protein